MPAGTITVTNGSATVTGSGTSFITELKAGDFIGVIVGGTPYTLIVASIASSTQLTIGAAYTGSTAGGLAWYAVPASLMYAVTQQAMNDMGKILRGMIQEKANWQQVYSASGNVTVTLPDGTQYSGPSWKSLATSLSGLGDSATRNVGTTAGTVAAGNDSRLSTVNNKTGGAITSAVTITAAVNALTIDGRQTESSGNVNNRLQLLGSSSTWDIFPQYYLVSGQYHCFRLVQNSTETFRANSNGACYAVSFNPTSDSRLKFNKRFIGDALSKSMTLRGMTYQIQGGARAGVIAQDAQKILPESVTVGGEEIVLEDGEIINDQLSLDYAGITALNTEALKDVVKLMLECLTDPDSAKSKLIKLVDSINASTDDANETDMRMEWALVNQSETPPEQTATDSANADH